MRTTRLPVSPRAAYAPVRHAAYEATLRSDLGVDGEVDDVLLVPMTAEFARCQLAGTAPDGDRWAPDYPLADEADAIRLFLAQDERDDPPGPLGVGVFGLYVVRDLPGRVAIGGIGFFGPPDDNGAVELGYGIVPSMRRRGVATAALRRMLAIARDNGTSTVRADTTVDNAASIRVLEKAGMRQVRSADGMVYFEVDVAGGTAPGRAVDDSRPADQ